MPPHESPWRQLPSVDALLRSPALAALEGQYGRLPLVDAIRATLDHHRAHLGSDQPRLVSREALEAEILDRLRTAQAGLTPVINATGVLLHTGLGRAPLAAEAIDAIATTAQGYCDLELDLETGERGRRADRVASLIRRLTGAQAATAVNNNAGATILAVKALAANREVIVSRGQLVEIGGSYRLPEIIEASGARLREVGTTNRTRLADYERAIGPETAAILRVYPSNYQVVGFSESVEIEPLAKLARARGIFVIDDIGSGALYHDRPPLASSSEPRALDSIAAGADLVLFSGDKLLGGPQAGILAGTSAAIERVERDPLMRALRLDKLVLAALEATLRLILDPALASRRIPLWALLQTPISTLRQRSESIAATLGAHHQVEATPLEACLGGGSRPGDQIPSFGLRIRSDTITPHELARQLRQRRPAVLARVQGGSLILDLRAVLPETDEQLASALRSVLS